MPDEREGTLSPSIDFNELATALKKTPGCLGVELATSVSGKYLLFAWFENKKAVLSWYHSDVHQRVMKSLFTNYKPRGPLIGVPDESCPIMAIASITMSDRSQFEEAPSLPISQISIELYQPLTGGLFLGERFAPSTLQVKDMLDFNPGSR